MALDAKTPSPVLPDLIALTRAARAEAGTLVEAARHALKPLVAAPGRIDPAALDRHQAAAHALAWMATYREALDQLALWAERLEGEARLGEVERLILQLGFAEYLAQLWGGLPMSQGELVRPTTIAPDLPGPGPAARRLMAGATAEARAALVARIEAEPLSSSHGATGLPEEFEMIRAQFRRFADDRVIPLAQEWHLKDDLIPMEVIRDLADMGVFGLTIPEAQGGLGLPKAAMVVVSEELSRGYIGVGSLATRSEIAAELILCGGTEAQKAQWLPAIASGAVLPTAVFTEPNTGSDLGSLSTRAVRDGDDWRVTGNKTWITHAARAGLMMMLVRTEPGSTDHRGLSLLVAEKTPGTDADPFPVPGMTGTEIGVLGYRGMKEYELAFDGFRVPGENLLGGVTGQGFRQLMQTFESARIQTAARAIGVAQSALEAGLAYALDRRQFGKPTIRFPRVADKLAMMAVEIMIARQLTYFAAAEKDKGKRCDLEAGMAKLLAARVAWAAADNAVQIHGGNGFAQEYPVSRILCDARVLNIFEGAAEIQAQVIARRLLEV
jgi:(2S)-methylsuccinyl-CoA dehydrogenase